MAAPVVGATTARAQRKKRNGADEGGVVRALKGGRRLRSETTMPGSCPATSRTTPIHSALSAPGWISCLKWLACRVVLVSLPVGQSAQSGNSTVHLDLAGGRLQPTAVHSPLESTTTNICLAASGTPLQCSLFLVSPVGFLCQYQT